MRGTGRLLVTAAVAVLLSGCSRDPDAATARRAEPPPAPSTAASQASEGAESGYDPTEEDQAQIEALVDARADAVLAGDEAAFLATLDPDRPALFDQQRQLFGNLVRLAPDALAYELDPSVLLVPAPVPGGDPAVRPSVVEHVTLDRTLRHALSNPIDITFVRRDGAWLVGSEVGPDKPGTLAEPQERPWFGGPIAVRRSGALMVLTDESRAGQLPDLVRSVQDGIARDADLLGLPETDAVLVDATSNGVPVGFSQLSEQEAAAVTFGLATYNGTGEVIALAGTAIKVNPDTVEEVLSDDRVLWHELVHFLLQRRTASSPKWLSEGVANWAEWQPYEMSSLVVPDKLYDQVTAADRRLPSVGLFNTSPATNYLVAQAAVEWLVDRGGVAQLGELMRAYAKAFDGPDVDRHTPTVLRRVYGVSEREVVAGAWDRLAGLQH